MTENQVRTGILVNRATKALEAKHSMETTAKPATCRQYNVSMHYYQNNKSN